ncbi:MAG: DUF3179 domain-containing protein [Oceanidesulfovibrio sp.]
MRSIPTLAGLVALALLFLLATVPLALAQDDGLQPESTEDAAEIGPDEGYYKEQREQVFETGMGRNNIPPINAPRYISVPDAALGMDDSENVFVLDYGNPDGVARIYPQQVLVWHVVVNEVLGTSKDARRRSITYCPITGCVRGYAGQIDGFDTPFGTLGPLLNGNHLLFDYSTNSVWPQLTGMAIDGPLQGKTLKSFPLVWTTWGLARQRYPDAQVLSRATGYRRNYEGDPYGSYRRLNTYYQDERVLHPLALFDERVPPKTRVLGLDLDDLNVAVVRDSLREPRAANFDAGVVPVVSLWDEALETPRLFDRRVANYLLHFVFRDGDYYDVETGTRWLPDGRAVEGRLADNRLALLDSFDVMWFAWAAFYPQTALFSWKEALAAEQQSAREFSPVEQVEPPAPNFEKPGTEVAPSLPNVKKPKLPKDIPPSVITPDMEIVPHDGL